MSNIITVIIAWVAGWHLERVFKLLHDNAEKLWEAVNPEVQQILKDSSAAVNIIQQGLNMTPAFVLDKIHDVIPFFTPEKLQLVLLQAGKIVNIGNRVDDPDLVTTVGNVQSIMKSMDQEDAKQYAEALANAIALYSTPPETSLSVIGSLMKFVFQTFVKDKYKVFA